jgi:hypothetical protein
MNDLSKIPLSELHADRADNEADIEVNKLWYARIDMTNPDAAKQMRETNDHIIGNMRIIKVIDEELKRRKNAIA